MGTTSAEWGSACRYAAGALMLGAVMLALLLLSAPAQSQWRRAEQDIMGTRITVEVYHEDQGVADSAISAVMEEMRRIDDAMSPYKPASMLSRINRDAALQSVPIDDELYGLIRQALEFSRITGGAFDISFASVGFLYDYREGLRPKSTALGRAVERIDYRRVVLDDERRTVSFGKEGVKIDLGGIAKGYAVDRGISVLEDFGIKSALVAAGGDSRVIGGRWGRQWNIGIRHPRKPDETVVVIPLDNVAVSTSGDYERYFVEEGVRYHHIIDPATGDSARELRSVTIIGPKAVMTDALSTSVFVMGVERGLALVESLPDIDAVLVDGKGELRYSSGLEPARFQ
jgi:thiamine biosynthesis lipoprotein